MNNLTELDEYRNKDLELKLYGCNGDSGNGLFKIPYYGKYFTVIASNGGGWEHVSVSTTTNKVPNWDAMCWIKDLFFNENETVVQFHPKKSEYVNNAETCLHLWKPINKEIELPPSIFTGIKEKQCTPILTT